ncbi:M20/M25/M40 family metallo-hydrolase [Spirochaeta dissipatitropha]
MVSIPETRDEITRLSRALQFRTISAVDEADIPDPQAFIDFENFLVRAFPLIHSELILEKPGKPGLLYFWKGLDPESDPIILTAHYDVVPVENPDTWTCPPFSGALQDDCVWGRGALDDKSSLMALMEAAESLLASGWKPQRSIYLAFGGDEEVTGTRGAARIAAHLKSSGVQAACLIDEGTAVVSDTISLVRQPIALIGTAEKGYLDVQLKVSGGSGHASMPERRSAAGILARALLRIEKRPFRPRMIRSTAAFLQGIASAAPPLVGKILQHPRLFRPLLLKLLAANPKTDAMIRSTQAPTMLEGSQAANVLPDSVSATINIRILPGETIEGCLQRLRRVMKDERVSLNVLHPEGANNPPPEASLESREYELLKNCISSHFPDAVISPYLVCATTDSKHYQGVSKNIYRFLPLRMGPQELAQIHSRNERISIQGYIGMIDFYRDLIRSLASPGTKEKQ